MAKPYNGHPSWNAWNVSLWINNDAGLYRELQAKLRYHGTRDKAARDFMDSHVGEKTPDGAPYSIRNVIRAMSGWEK